MRITISWRQTPDFWLYWLPPLLWGLAILFFSGDWGSSRNTLGLIEWLLSWVPGLTPAQVGLIHGYLRKLGHVVAYGALSFLWFRAFRANLRYSKGRAFLWALGLCLLLVLMDEGHQTFLPSRRGSLRDVALDLSGAGLGGLVTLAFWHPRNPKTHLAR